MKALAIFSIAVMCAATVGQAQDRVAIAQKFAASAKANAAALKQYAWQMRVQLTLKGDPKPAKLYAMRFGMNGLLEKTELTPEAPPEELRGLRGRIREKKIKEMKEFVGEVSDLAKTYLTPTPDALQTFFSKSTTVEAPGGLLQIYATDVITPHDKLVYEITPDTQAIKRVMFNAFLDNDALDGQAQFATIPNGPNYAARTTVNVPGKELTAVVENFQYVKQ